MCDQLINFLSSHERDTQIFTNKKKYILEHLEKASVWPFPNILKEV